MPSVWKSPSACSTRFLFSSLTILFLGAPLAAAHARVSLDIDRLPASERYGLALLALADSIPAPSPAVEPPQAPPPAAMTVPSKAPKEPKHVNPRKALLMSLLLPGTGELYSGHRGRATGFFISEGAIWANFAAWEIAGHLRKDDYIEQAQINAGVGTSSGSDDYWRLVGSYLSSNGSGADSYEESLRRDARNEFPDDPAAQDAYVAARLPSGDQTWSWSSAAAQQSYIETRQNSTRAYNRAKFSIALGILNRLASAIDTQILHRKDSKAEGSSSLDESGIRLLATVTRDGGGMLLIRHRF